MQDVQQHFGALWRCASYKQKVVVVDLLQWQKHWQNLKTVLQHIYLKQLDNTGNNSAKIFVDFLNNKCGLQTKIEPNPSIALGACEISLYEMLQAYSMLPGQGF